MQGGETLDLQAKRQHFDIDYVGTAMPPPWAVEQGLVKPLSDADRRTIARWIDLGCPIDLESDDGVTGLGWFLDDDRPTLAVTYPRPGEQAELSRILIGMHDYESGLDFGSITITADVPLFDQPAGTNLAQQFTRESPGVYAWNFGDPLTELPRTTLAVSIRDAQGNTTEVRRTFWVGGKK